MALFSVGTLLGIAGSFVMVRVLDDLMVGSMKALPSSFHIFVIDPLLMLYVVIGASLLSVLSGLVPAMIASTKAPSRQLQEASD
jgi:ABC-type lipoprotein release transport system permease subunit